MSRWIIKVPLTAYYPWQQKINGFKFRKSVNTVWNMEVLIHLCLITINLYTYVYVLHFITFPTTIETHTIVFKVVAIGFVEYVSCIAQKFNRSRKKV